ncbi:hypothetical protein DL96DRAFT_1710377 [Flagelloscypha sp. PMI_526]|nr:hypothetical protein DL96DRAFT_1710377 [Flagelloscypha sp. PMI_526]
MDEQHPISMYFPDGNIILKAQGIVFRVFKGVLAAQCLFFKDMIDVASADEKDGSLSEVEVTDDPEELESFLRCFFDTFFLQRVSPTDIKTLIGIVRLSHKYMATTLFRYSLQKISCLCPVQLSTEPRHVPIHRILTIPTLSQQEIHSLIHVAREVDAIWMLPALYYDLIASTDVTHLVEQPAEVLSPLDKSTLLTAFVKQPLTFLDVIRFLLPLPGIHNGLSSGCLSTEKCRQGRAKALNVLLAAREQTGWKTPFSEWDKHLRWGGYTGFYTLVCENCLHHAQDNYKAACLELWTTLPNLYGLPEWSVLLERKTEVLGQKESGEV